MQIFVKDFKNFFPALLLAFTAFAIIFATVTFNNAYAQERSGRRVDMRAVAEQGHSCRQPAMNLYQRVIVLRQGIRDILDCNARGEFFIDDECVPAVTLDHRFDERSGTDDLEGRSRLGFGDEETDFEPFGVIGGLNGADVTCAKSCEEETQSRDVECPPGQSGTITEERNFLCPQEIWTDWAEVANNCSDECEEETQTRNVDCPEGESGTIIEEREFLCPQEEWTDWVEVSNTCSDECVEETETRDVDCPEVQVGTIIEERNFQCPQEEWTDWVEISNNCSDICVEDFETREAECPPGETGFVLERRDFECPQAEWTDWAAAENFCEDVTCPAQNAGWSEDGNSCDGTVSQTSAGDTDTANDNDPPTTGSATFLCQNDGTWGPATDVSCEVASPDCTGANVTWPGTDHSGNHACSCVGAAADADLEDLVTVRDSDESGPFHCTGEAEFKCTENGFVFHRVINGCRERIDPF